MICICKSLCMCAFNLQLVYHRLYINLAFFQRKSSEIHKYISYICFDTIKHSCVLCKMDSKVCLRLI